MNPGANLNPIIINKPSFSPFWIFQNRINSIFIFQWNRRRSSFRHGHTARHDYPLKYGKDISYAYLWRVENEGQKKIKDWFSGQESRWTCRVLMAVWICVFEQLDDCSSVLVQERVRSAKSCKFWKGHLWCAGLGILGSSDDSQLFIFEPLLGPLQLGTLIVCEIRWKRFLFWIYKTLSKSINPQPQTRSFGTSQYDKHSIHIISHLIA